MTNLQFHENLLFSPLNHQLYVEQILFGQNHQNMALVILALFQVSHHRRHSQHFLLNFKYKQRQTKKKSIFLISFPIDFIIVLRLIPKRNKMAKLLIKSSI